MGVRRTVTLGLAACCAALAVAVTGCSDSRANGPSADCAWELHYGGHVYLPDHRRELVHSGKPLGRGVLPGCSEGGASKAIDQRVTVYRIPGVDPASAVITQDNTTALTNPADPPAALHLPPSPSTH